MAYRSHNRLARPLALLAAGSLATVVLLGCSDPTVERQVKFEQELSAVATEYAKTLGSRPDLLSKTPTDESLAALRALADRANGLSGGSSTQQTAARALSLSISRTTGALALDRAQAIEASHEVVRGLARSALGLAGELDAVADAGGRLDLAQDRAELQRRRDEASRTARALQSTAASIDGPLGQVESRMKESAARLAQLEQENAVLLRKARESNPQTGLAFVEEAATVQGDSRSVRTALANDGIARGEFALERSLTERSLQSAQGLQSAAAEALDFLGAFEADVSSNAQKSRTLASELRAQADSMLKAVADERTSVVARLFQDAAADLGKASGATGALANAVTSDELRLAYAQFSSAIAEARTVVATQGTSAAGLGELKANAETLLTSLRERATATADQLANTEEDPSLAVMKRYVDAVKKMADGADVAKMLAPAVEPKPAANANAAGRPRADSPDAGPDNLSEIIARIGSLGSDPSAISAFMIEIVDDSTGAGRAMKSIMSQSLKAIEPINAAILEKFGADAAKAIGESMTQGMGGMGGMGAIGAMGGGDFSALTEKSNDGRTAVFSMGGETELTFVRRASGWKLDLLAGMDPSMVPMLEQAAPMMGMMMGPMKKAAESVAARVRAGEFANAEEAMQAFQSEMMKSMGGGFGGE
jgi:hypothetical protein